MKNYYDILGIKIDSDSNSIKDAYRKLSKKFHPDLNPNDDFFEKMFRNLNEAKEVLLDESSKHNYDKVLDLHLSKFDNANTTREDIERQVKEEFQEILRKKEKEIKRKYYAINQLKNEEQKLSKEKEEERQKIIIDQLKTEFNKLRIEEKDIKLRRNQINTELEKLSKRQKAIVTRKEEIDKKINPDNIDSNTVENDNNKAKINLEPELVKSLDNIKQQVDLTKREIFFKSLINYCSSKSMSAKFVSDNPDLAKMILSSKFNNNEFAKVYKRSRDQTDKKMEFENFVVSYIT